MILPPSACIRRWFAVLLPLVLFSSLPAQQIFGLMKTQGYFQTSASTVTSYSARPFTFEIRSGGGGTLQLPAGGSISFNSVDREEGDRRVFGTKADLDAAFPNGAYRLNVGIVPPLALSVTPELYPASAPQVVGLTNATWTSGGVIAVTNRAQPVVLTFNGFPEFAAAGSAGLFNLDLSGIGNPLEMQLQAISRPLLGLPVQATSPTSFTIPANQLIAGGWYSVEVSFWTLVTVDTASVNGVAFSGFAKGTEFMLVVPGTGPAPLAPVFTSQPASLTRPPGGSATFTITGSDNPNGNLTNSGIRWLRDGIEMITLGPKYSLPANRTQLTVNNLTSDDAGVYTVQLINSAGVANSLPAILTVADPNPPAPPRIAVQPVSHTVSAGNTVVFSVEATGNPAPTYQWRRGTTVLPTETRPTLVLNGPGVTAGTYSCVVTNSLGSATSADATLTVSNVQATNVGRLINLSVLAPTGPGDQLLTMGATVGGQGAAGSLPLVIRGIGPTLGSFGVGGVLADPVLSILTAGSSTPSATNDNWGGTPALVSAFASVGAFALPAASLDSAALLNQTAGGIVVQVAGKGTASGTVIAEVYDAAGSARGATTPRLTNLSTLTSIAPGDTLSAGFVIGGTTSRTVLVRAVGPTLGTAFGIGGAMADPKLEFFNNATSTKIAENDNWGGPSWLLAANGAVGAFALSGAGSRDAALLITLAPGQYSARVSGVGGTGGTAIIEVYEVP